jgi:pantetheine-phosphate adenylyltransferase
MKKVAVGGTFEILHKGHEALLKKAFGLGEVTVGLTSDRFAEKMRKRKVEEFSERKRKLEEFIFKKFKKKAKIVKIEDIFGPTLNEDFDFLVVSPETFKNAIKINRVREKLGKKPIKIVKVKMFLAEDGKPISSTRIKNGEIDENGKECAFCKIVKGKKKCLKVYENKKFLAFLDKNPRNPGHLLVIPKKHFRYVWDVPYIGEYFKTVQKLAKTIQRTLNTEWIISPVMGEEIKHAHVHLIPRFKNDNFSFVPPPVKKLSYSKMKKIQEKIKEKIKEL